MKDESKKTSSTKDDTTKKQAPIAATKAISKKKAAPAVKQKTGAGTGWFAIILVIAATTAGFFAFTQLKQQIEQLSGDIRSVKDNSSELAQGIQSNTSKLADELSDLSKQLTTTEQIFEEKTALLQKQVGKNRRQWLIVEAEYLTSVANTRLLLAGDLETATAALQAADQRLKENGDPITFPIRKQLAKEINTLKSTEMPDIVGISSQLIALENAVAKMDINEPHAGTAQAPEIGKGDASPIPENIQDTLNDAWENFSKLVVVRRHDKPLAALMTPERVELIRKNLALKLESARLALIDKNEALYAANISICMDWLDDYFDANNPAVKTAIEQLNTLKDTPITAELPSIALSLKMLRNLPLLNVAETPQKAPITSQKTSSAAPVVVLPQVIKKQQPAQSSALENETDQTSSEAVKADQ